MKQANVKFTYEDYVLLPGDRRYELVEGGITVVPAPNLDHQRILRRLEKVLLEHIEQNHLGELFFAPCDVVLSAENVVQPDLFFVSAERAGILTEANVQGAPDLVIEILSEGTRQHDLQIKRKLYARFGIPEYWIVDPAAKTIEVLAWTEAGYRAVAVYSHDARLASSVFPKLDLNLSEIF